MEYLACRKRGTQALLYKFVHPFFNCMPMEWEGRLGMEYLACERWVGGRT